MILHLRLVALQRHGTTLPVVAMAFALMPRAVTKIAVGMKSAEEVELNCETLRQTRSVPLDLWNEALRIGLLDTCPVDLKFV